MRCTGRRLRSEKAALEFKISEAEHFQGWQGAGCRHEYGVGHLHSHKDDPGHWQVLDGKDGEKVSEAAMNVGLWLRGQEEIGFLPCSTEYFPFWGSHPKV